MLKDDCLLEVMMDNEHAYMCIFLHCGRVCTPKVGSKGKVIIYHTCAGALKIWQTSEGSETSYLLKVSAESGNPD